MLKRDDFRDLPERYRSMPAGDLILADQTTNTSLGITAGVLVFGAALLWVFYSAEKQDAPRRRAALDAARQELSRRQRR